MFLGHLENDIHVFSDGQLLAKFVGVCQHWRLYIFWQNVFHPVILLYCNLYILSFGPFVILSVWQHVKLLICELLSLQTFQLMHLHSCLERLPEEK